MSQVFFYILVNCPCQNIGPFSRNYCLLIMHALTKQRETYYDRGRFLLEFLTYLFFESERFSGKSVPLLLSHFFSPRKADFLFLGESALSQKMNGFCSPFFHLDIHVRITVDLDTEESFHMI